MASAIFSLKLTSEQNALVQHLASVRSQSPDGILREAVARFLDQENRREQLRKDTIAAWEDYQATGLHATAEETDAWLARLEAGEAAEAPICHL